MKRIISGLVILATLLVGGAATATSATASDRVAGPVAARAGIVLTNGGSHTFKARRSANATVVSVPPDFQFQDTNGVSYIYNPSGYDLQYWGYTKGWPIPGWIGMEKGTGWWDIHSTGKYRIKPE